MGCNVSSGTQTVLIEPDEINVKNTESPRQQKINNDVQVKPENGNARKFSAQGEYVIIGVCI